MNRIVLFAKGNVDVHDSLHSCRIGGKLLWNGINDIVREHYPGTTVRIIHETCTRLDAVIAANGLIPPEVQRDVPLGAYPLKSQFSAALFDTPADAYILSILPDMLTDLYRHKRTGALLYPNGQSRWSDADRAWFCEWFEPAPMLDAATAMDRLRAVIDRIRLQSDAPVLVYNASAVVPGETVHCLQGFDDSFTTRARKFNVGLAELSQATGISVIDVDCLISRAGADSLKHDAVHLAPEGHRLVCAEVVRVLHELGVLEPEKIGSCA